MPLRTAHLEVDDEPGAIWIHSFPWAWLFDRVEAGIVGPRGGIAEEWPDELGEEPGWFAVECDELDRMIEEAREEAERKGVEERSLMLQEYISTCIGNPR